MGDHLWVLLAAVLDLVELFEDLVEPTGLAEQLGWSTFSQQQ